MADYGDIADAIAARFLGTTPPSGESAIRLATADLPNGITLTPCFLVFDPDDAWTGGTGLRSGTLTFPCRLVLAQADEPRTQRALMNWRTALYQRLDGAVKLGGAIPGVQNAVVTKTATGTLAYAGENWASVEVTVVVSIAEGWTVAA